MIVETILSTLDEAGNPNFAPMGIVWDQEFPVVRPFRSSNTFRNLASTGFGVVNLADDILAYVRCALYDAVLPHFPAKMVPGIVFQGTCSWRELKVMSQAGSTERAEFVCRVVNEGRQRDFLGFRRASNAVLEAAILATRLPLASPDKVIRDLLRCGEIVDKTGDETERQALQLIRDYVQKRGR